MTMKTITRGQLTEARLDAIGYIGSANLYGSYHITSQKGMPLFIHSSQLETAIPLRRRRTRHYPAKKAGGEPTHRNHLLADNAVTSRESRIASPTPTLIDDTRSTVRQFTRRPELHDLSRTAIELVVRGEADGGAAHAPALAACLHTARQTVGGFHAGDTVATERHFSHRGGYRGRSGCIGRGRHR